MEKFIKLFLVNQTARDFDKEEEEKKKKKILCFH